MRVRRAVFFRLPVAGVQRSTFSAGARGLCGSPAPLRRAGRDAHRIGLTARLRCPAAAQHLAVYKSEADIAREVWHHTGLAEGVRHPLTYVMEACDDIAYSIIDAEDIVKKGYASFYDLMDSLESFDPGDSVIQAVIRAARAKNEEYKQIAS